jgi:hypothetical protein
MVRASRVLAMLTLLGALLVVGAAGAQTRGDNPPQCNGLDATIFGVAPLVGTDGPDVIVGTAGPDVIDAGGGDDVICALGGRDRINAGDGNDLIFAGRGIDRVRPGDGDDIANGGRGWDHCTESAGLDTHVRCERKIVAKVDGPLVGVPIGTTAEQTIEALTAVLGPPKEDSGWIIGCELDDPVAANERTLRWGGLAARLYREGSTEVFQFWAYRVDFTTLKAPAGGPLPFQVTVLPGDPTFGGSIADAATATGGTAIDTEVFGYQVQFDGMVLYSFASGQAEESDPFVQVGVPFVAACE